MQPLSNHYFTNDIYIIEGMDMTGKTTFLQENMPDYKLYAPKHDLTDATGNRSRSWIIGHGIVEFLEQTTPINMTSFENGVVINRGVFSSYVYDRLYENKVLDPQILDWYKNNDFFKSKIGHIYIRHHDADTAREIFEKSRNREVAENATNKKYDQFNSFNDYWIFYNAADQLFREAYQLVGVRPRVFETLPNMTWNEVTMR